MCSIGHGIASGFDAARHAVASGADRVGEWAWQNRETIIETAIEVGACTLLPGAGCVIANLGVDAWNAYFRYQQYGLSEKFFVGTGADVVGSLINMKSLTSFYGKGLEGELGTFPYSNVLRDTIVRRSDIPGRMAAGILGKNALIGSATSMGNWLVNEGNNYAYPAIAGR